MIDVKTKEGHVHMRKASGSIMDIAADVAMIVKSIFDNIKKTGEEEAAYTFVNLCADTVNFVRCTECEDDDADDKDDEEDDDDDDIDIDDDADDFTDKVLRLIFGE